MKKKMRVAVVNAAERHEHPALDILGAQRDGHVLDDLFEIRHEKLEDEPNAPAVNKYVKQLKDVGVAQFAHGRNLAERREIDAARRIADADLFNGHLLAALPK